MVSTRWSLGAGAVMVAVIIAMAARGQGQSYLPDNQLDAMDASMFLNHFKSAAIAAGYEAMLGSNNFTGTVFAPVDQGFDAYIAQHHLNMSSLANGTGNGSQILQLLQLHIIPGVKIFPISSVKQGDKINTMAGRPLYADFSTPGVTHIYSVKKPELDPLNFATILQYQMIQGGKSILYVVDRPIAPQPTGAVSTN
ncbi:MAG: hypothetical protein WDW38_009488 [Sanguina aurantia]